MPEPTTSDHRQAALAAETGEKWSDAAKAWREAIHAYPPEPSVMRDADMAEFRARADSADRMAARMETPKATLIEQTGGKLTEVAPGPEKAVGQNLATGAL